MKEYDNEIITEIPGVTLQPKFSPPLKKLQEIRRDV